MKKISVLGAGRIGSLLACLLAQEEDYDVFLIDNRPIDLTLSAIKKMPNVVTLDVSNHERLEQFFQQQQITGVISCLPYYYNIKIAELAKRLDLHYFDLTEDVATKQAIKTLSEKQSSIFATNCGLAPGLVNIIAAYLFSQFDEVDRIDLRVGNLPQDSNHVLGYALTWSTDGLINQYANTCYGLSDGIKKSLEPLEGLETVVIDGAVYEAFNTSGGIGGLIECYEGKIKHLNYKTLRYPGHRDKIYFLMNELKLSKKRALLKEILEEAVPQTIQDVAIVFVNAVGMVSKKQIEMPYVKKFYPREFFGTTWSAIQVTTSLGACAVVDLMLNHLDRYQGYVAQEQINLTELKNNRFGKLLEL